MTTTTGNGPALQAQLDHVAGRIETIFESASAELFGLLEEAEAASTTLVTVAAIGGREGRARLNGAVEATQTHIERIEARYRYLTETAEALRAHASRLRGVLQEQARDMKLAALIATNARIVSSTVAASDGALARFANDVRELLEQAGDSMDQLRDQLRAADDKLASVSGPVQAMVARARELGRTRAELPTLMHQVTGDSTLDKAAQSAGAGMTDLMGALERAVSHLQAGDSARQRLEHVRSILKEAEDLDAVGRQVLETLAAAQMSAAVEALDRAVEATLPELAGIEKPWKATMGLMSALAGSATAQVLKEISVHSSNFAEGLAALETLRTKVGPDMAQIAELYSRGAETAMQVSHLEDRMNLLGINAILVSERCGDDGHAMTEVSRQLRSTTVQIGVNTRVIVELSNEQKEKAGLFQVAEAEDAQETTENDMIEQLRQDVEALSGALASMGQTFDWRSRRSPVEDVRQSLVYFAKDMSERLSLPPDRGKAVSVPNDRTRQVLDAIREIYTMQAERDLHDRILGVSPAATPPAAASPSAASEDDLDDVFFG
ncbi:hypothetical protein [Allosediminivita pacifica]|uniref:hypothetical protein n=1 Tax=Allosediminivita pacifica TaxID=1267769 RepID=UPI001304862B|nr:hypothetical protein [Allosediminivita pacifica]